MLKCTKHVAMARIAGRQLRFKIFNLKWMRHAELYIVPLSSNINLCAFTTLYEQDSNVHNMKSNRYSSIGDKQFANLNPYSGECFSFLASFESLFLVAFENA